MAEGGSFLIPSEGDQARLSFFDELPADVAAAVQTREDKGEFDASRFFAQQPKLYVACVRLLGCDLPVQTIAKLLSVSDNTVRAVRDRETVSVADFRAKQGKRRRGLMSRIIDRMEATIGEADFKDLVIGYGILDDKERLDSGSPTQIHGTVVPRPASDDYAEYLKNEGFIDVPSTVERPVMGTERTLPEQKGGAPGSGDPDLAAEGDSSPPDDQSDS